VVAAAVDDGTWDCSVCTFKNNAEAFKCSMCDVRKGTSTRKPRLNPDLVAAQQAQALTPPPPPFPLMGEAGPAGLPLPPAQAPIVPIFTPPAASSVESPVASSSKLDSYDPDNDPDLQTPAPVLNTSSASKAPKKTPAKKNEGKKTQNKARLKNVDRSSATYHSVTVDDFTVVITEFKPKAKKEKKEKKEKVTKVSNATGLPNNSNVPIPPNLLSMKPEPMNSNLATQTFMPNNFQPINCSLKSESANNTISQAAGIENKPDNTSHLTQQPKTEGEADVKPKNESANVCADTSRSS